MRIGILGRKKDTKNYENYATRLSATPITTLNPGEIAGCDVLLLPGGGDITPAFFGMQNNGSRDIDTELDILQLQAFEYALGKQMPILGICKGMQLINVGLGGTLVQDLPTASVHRYHEGDQYHNTCIAQSSFLYELYGETALVNSAHHQGLQDLGKGLQVIQWCPEDKCIEAIVHESLPILGLQWHPERIDNRFTSVSGDALLAYFLSKYFPR